MIIAWRIVRRLYWPTAFEGIGSATTGGRWNSIGVPMVYLTDTLALAQLELLVNVPRDMLPIWDPWMATADLGLAISDYGVTSIEIDEHLVTSIPHNDLPHDWRRSPWPQSTQELGDKWIREKSSLILRLPSAVSPTDFNYLLNPLHADFRKIHIGSFRPFSFDPRLAR